MDFTEVILKRRSTRKYGTQEVSSDALLSVEEAGLLAPTSRNKRHVEFIEVRDKNVLSQMADSKTAGADMLKEASCAIVVVGDREVSDVWVEDTSIAMTYMMLRATDLGIANCWIQCRKRVSKKTDGNENISSEEFIKQLLDIPQNYSPLAILSLGISDEIPRPHTKSDVDFSKIHKGTW